MNRLVRLTVVSIFTSTLILFSALQVSAQPKNKDVLKTMRTATDFMMNTVSYNGGFVWQYSADLSEQWGEVPARRTMIWVQDPGTIGVGTMLLDAFKATGDSIYLAYAERTADAIIWGQHPSGGWHYFIDFDMPKVRQYYNDVLSKCWGWEEYYHYYGNCTFDDGVSSGATRFLMDVYMTTLDPKYRTPLLKALDFVLESQFPNGAWPQRYPLSHEYPHDGHEDYTSFYTFNDNVIEDNIQLLLDAWEQLGNEEYAKAAYRGMDFVYLSQLAKPQAGWGQQYDHNMNSAPARSYEPASVMPGQTRQCIFDLIEYYHITGNRKYLRGIPDAIEWLEASKLPADHITEESRPGVTHATFYELGTNKPLYAHREGTSIETGRYWIDYTPVKFLEHYGAQSRIDIDQIKREYERAFAQEPDEAMQEYRTKKALPPSTRNVKAEDVETLMKTLDTRGAWVQEISIPDYKDVVNNPRRKLQGINTGSYIRNMTTLINYLKASQK